MWSPLMTTATTYVKYTSDPSKGITDFNSPDIDGTHWIYHPPPNNPES